MKQIVPNYYWAFRCLADRCRHSCCTADWEIDIDAQSYRLYRAVDGTFGKRLWDGIDHQATPPHFCFTADKRCPLLNENGLCDIIVTLGEGALCDICRDHPRFRNFFSDRTEVGLGLCCEEACRLVLENPEPVRLVEIDDNGEEAYLTEEEHAFLAWRDGIFAILQDRRRTIDERLSAVAAKYHIRFPADIDWVTIYRSLERLDPAWDTYLDRWAASGEKRADHSLPDTVWEQLAVYLVFRHTADGLDDGRLIERLAFCLHAMGIIRSICTAVGADFEEMQNICRLYSGEIEYSDENVEKLLAILE